MPSLPDQLLPYLDRALDQLAAVVTDLGEERVNARVDTPGANSAFVVVTHCMGVMRYWAHEVNLGMPVGRDRAAEFRAEGSAADLLDALARARTHLHEDVAACDPDAPPARVPDDLDTDRHICDSQGSVLIHVYEELAQHLGQLEVTRDVLLAAGR